MIRDNRANKARPWGYIVCTDTFMSGFGPAKGGRSLYALAVAGPSEANTVARNARARSEMKRPRLVRSFRADGTPSVRMGPNDHMSVVDRRDAERWYEPGAW